MINLNSPRLCFSKQPKTSFLPTASKIKFEPGTALYFDSKRRLTELDNQTVIVLSHVGDDITFLLNDKIVVKNVQEILGPVIIKL